MRAVFSFFSFMLLFASGLYAQSGGGTSFNFINLPSDAYGAALGGVNILSSSNDPNAIFYNPASIHKDADNNLGLSYTPYLAGVSNSNVAYSKNFKSLGAMSFGLQYLNYGTITETDPSGNVIGDFRAQDYAFLVGKSHTVGLFTMGAGVKFAGSNIGGYSSYAVMADLGGYYKHKTEDLKVGMVIKNVGVVMKNYLPGSSSSTPFDVQVSGRYKPAHMPVRLSLTAVSLTNYDYPENSFLEVTNATQQASLSTFGKISRHFIIGAEVLFSKNVALITSYNMKRQQLSVQGKYGSGSVSMGMMVNVRAVQFSYSYSFYYKTAGVQTYSLFINPRALFTKRVKGPIEI